MVLTATTTVKCLQKYGEVSPDTHTMKYLA